MTTKNSYWMKLYTEILDDPKMGTMPDHLWRRCIELFLVARRTGADGMLPTVNEIAWMLHTTEDDVRECLTALQERGIVRVDGERYVIAHFAERQAPSSVNERVQRYREAARACNENVTKRYKCNAENCNENVTNRYSCNAPDTDTDTDTDTDAEAQKTVSSANRTSTLFAEIAAVCEHSDISITPYVARQIARAETALAKARASPADVAQFAEYWRTQDWRGKRGEPIEPHHIVQEWERFEKWRKKQSDVNEWDGWVKPATRDQT